jgi:hypothetical protein
MHKTDKEALQAIGVLVGAIVLVTAALWFNAIISGQC